MMPSPDALRTIAARLTQGIVSTEDAQVLLDCATQWRRVEVALDQIVEDAMEEAVLAERAMQAGTVVRFHRQRG